MDAGPLAAVGEGVGVGDGETVCAALSRYESTLRDAVREIHVDVSAFKLGVERRLEEALHVSGPLGRAVAQLQQENRQLRSQLEALTRQVEVLTCTACDRSALLGPASGLQQLQQNPGAGSGASSGSSGGVGVGTGSSCGGGAGVGTGTGSSCGGTGQHQMHGLGSGTGTGGGGGSSQSPTAPSSPCVGVTGSASGLASSPTAVRFSSRATFAVSSKTNGVSLAPPGDFTEKDLYKRQWMQVQSMANRFWSRWRAEYLQSLQPRRKWQDEQRNIGVGDLVLLRDAQAVRNEWPMAIITAVFPGQDGKVRKVELKVAKEGATKKFLRPVSEIVLLMEKED
ncbi:hypothetical protein ACEWY4_008605 [Coilia grayii]|uniref:DUF5641 domain-containing protein n=1 Tax=Coilia grayii TaxID=363190 RepID=A0ABD1KBC4_9TELE